MKRVEDLVLLRIAVAPKGRRTQRALVKDLAKLLPAEACERSLAALRDAGDVTAEAIELTPPGRARASAILGKDKMPAKLTWRSILDTHLPGIALNMKSVKSAEALAVRLFADASGVAAETMTEAIDKVVLKELGIDAPRLTLEAVRGHVLARRAGSHRLKPKKIAQLIAAKHAGARGVRAKDIQRALVLGWLSARTTDPVEDLDAFSRLVRDAVASPATSKFGDRAFIGSVWSNVTRRAPTLTREEFVARLLDSHRAGLITLHRADLVSAMDPKDVSESEIQFDNATFHLVSSEGSHAR